MAYSTGMFPIGSHHTCYYVQQKPYGPSVGDLKVYIPDLLPLISMGLAKDTPVGNRVPSVNAGDCKVDGNAQVTTHNYFRAKAPNTPYKHSLIDYGATLVVEARIMDGNLMFKLVEEEADPSHD